MEKLKLEAPPGGLNLSFFKSWSPEEGLSDNKGFNLEKRIKREHLSKLLNHLAKTTETGMEASQVSLELGPCKWLYLGV